MGKQGPGGLLAQIQERTAATRKGPRCGVAIILAKLDDADRADLLAALADDDLTQKAIADVLTNAGHQIGAQAIGNHRRKDCRCEPR